MTMAAWIIMVQANAGLLFTDWLNFDYLTKVDLYYRGVPEEVKEVACFLFFYNKLNKTHNHDGVLRILGLPVYTDVIPIYTWRQQIQARREEI